MEKRKLTDEDVINYLAEKVASTPLENSKWTREQRVAICRWVIRTLCRLNQKSGAKK